MRYSLCCLVLLFVVCLRAQTQKTFIVNNATSAPADYHNLQTAIDSVPAGSIILLQPSAVTYDPVTIRKRVAIFGSGYFLGQNAAPATQANLITSKVQYINFAKGSDGSSVSGLHFTRNSGVDHAHFDSTSSITVTRCYFESQSCGSQGCVPQQFSFKNATLITVQQCYIATPECHLTFGAENAAGVVFQNNIINGNDFGNSFAISPSSNVSLNFNTIVVTGSNFYTPGWLMNNNIFLKLSQSPGDTAVTFSSYGNPYQGPDNAGRNNVSNYSILPAGANKTMSRVVGADSLFLTYNNSQSIASTDGYFILKPNGPAAGYASDKTDCGAYGGSTPYLLSGIPAIPNIYFLQLSANPTQAGGLKLNIKTKANN